MMSVSNQLETCRVNTCALPDKQCLQPPPLGPKTLPFSSIVATTHLTFFLPCPLFFLPEMPNPHTGLGSFLHLRSDWLASVLNSTVGILTAVYFHMPHIVHSIP